MSIRSEPKAMSAGMQHALMIPSDVMRNAAATTDAPLSAPTGQELALAGANTGALADQNYASANDFNTTNAAHPLKRTVVVNIRSSLNDLCLKKSRATWAPPSAEATRAIFQQRKFTDLQALVGAPTPATPTPATPTPTPTRAPARPRATSRNATAP